MIEQPSTPRQVDAETLQAQQVMAFITEFFNSKLSTYKTPAFGLSPKGEQPVGAYEPKHGSFFPTSIETRAEKLTQALFESIDAAPEIGQRYALLERETPVLYIFRNTLASLLSVAWFAVAKGWDGELCAALEREAQHTMAKAVSQGQLPLIYDGE